MEDTLLVDGLELPDVCLEWPYEWPYQGNPEGGEIITYPGVDGGLSSGDRPYPPKLLSVPLTIADDDDCNSQQIAPANSRWEAVVSACKPARNVVLTRRMTFAAPNPADPPVVRDTTSAARYVGLLTTRPIVDVTKAVLEFMLLDGVWYAAPVTIGTGVVTVDGTTRTHRMVVTLAGATGQTLTNSNGWSFTYNGASGAGVDIDVENMTVAGGSAANLQWSRRLPFRLDPGENTIDLTGGGTATITYQPAYL